MALDTRMSDTAVNAQATTLSAQCNSGIVRVYDGARPANAETAVGAQVLGVTLTLNATAFAAPVAGLLTANAITGGTAVANITPTWARVFQSNGTTVVMDIEVSASGSNMTLGAFTTGTTVTCSAFTHNVRKATTGV